NIHEDPIYIRGNNISKLVSTNTSGQSRTVGILQKSTSAAPQIIERNRIYNLSTYANGTGSTIAGMDIYGPASNIHNNKITLGNQMYMAAEIHGMRLNLTVYPQHVPSIYNNSIYIGGLQNGNSDTRAITYVGEYRVHVYNNILMNDRTTTAGFTGNHYSRFIESSSIGVYIRPVFRHNIMFGTASNYSMNGGTGVANVESDNGIFSNPQFLAPTSMTPDLHINPNVQSAAEGRGMELLQDVDYDLQTRAAHSPHDIGADAGLFLPLQMPVISSVSASTPACAGSSSVVINGTSLGNVTQVKIGTTIIPIHSIVHLEGNSYVIVLYPNIAASGLVSVTNLVGTASSSTPITIAQSPVITSQPQSITMCSMQTSTMSVVASNATSYQWRRNGVNLTNNPTYSNVTTANLTITNPSAAAAGNYDVVVAGTASNCTTTSAQAVLTMGGQPVTLVASGPTSICQGGSVTLTPMIDVPALQLDGIDDYFAKDGGELFGDMTMEFWLKTTQTGPPGTSWNQGNGIVDCSTGANTTEFGTSLLGNKLAFGIMNPHPNNQIFTLTSNAAVNTGQWIHVVITRASNGSEVRMYLNGTLDNSAPAFNWQGNISTSGMTVGRIQDEGNYFQGSIDNVRMWNRILNGPEIAAASGENIINPQSLTNNFPINESSGTSTTNAVTGSLTAIYGNPQWTTRQAAANFLGTSWSNGENTPTITVSTSGDYSMMGYMGGGCPSSSNEIAVTVESPNVQLTNFSTYMCGGAPVQLTATGAETYTWSPAQGLSATTGTSVTANPTQPTTYTVTGTTASGCIDSFTFTVQQAPNMPITVSTSHNYIMPGQTATLTATGNMNYYWTPSTGLNTTFGGTVEASPTQTTTYTVTGAICGAPQTVTIYVLSAPSPTDNALDFDGIDDYVSMPIQPNGISGTFTVAAWVKPTHPTKTMHVFSTRNGASGNTFDIQIRNGNQIHGDIGDGNNWLTTAADADYAYQPNVWMHIAYVVQPGQYRIYVNGNLVKQAPYPGTAVLYNNTSNFITIGKNGGENTFLQGTIDDLLISTAAFPTEIMANVPRHGMPAQANYTFNQGIPAGSNPTVNILVGPSQPETFHGTLHNFALNGPASNWVNGQVTMNQTITFNAIPQLQYGAPNYTLTATSTSGLPITYQSTNPQVATVSGNVLTIVGIGAAQIIATQPGNAFYHEAMPTDQLLIVTQKALSITNAVAANKVYDRNTAATISGVLTGVVGSDNVSFTGNGNFASMLVGNNIAVTTSLQLTGAHAQNYTLVQPGGLTANITKKSITTSGSVANNKIYDGTAAATISGSTLSGVISPDVVTILTNTGTFSSASVGNNKPVTANLTIGGANAANYELVQPTGLMANITAATGQAVISGGGNICPGEIANFIVTLSGGDGPYTIVYSNGSTNTTVNNYVSGSAIAVSPLVATNYSLISASGPNHSFTTSGVAAVTIKTYATLFVDSDGDGYTNGTQDICYSGAVPAGYASNSLGNDCDDNNVAIYNSGQLYIDTDNDGYNNGVQTVCYGAAVPTGYAMATLGSDCNDANALVYQSGVLYVDADNDGYGNGAQTVCYGALVPQGYAMTSLGSDCNDANAA
ncbi:MAG TPA: LamG-like jellyroll fold domain-containing protein, partial [Fibrella sp.]